VRPLTSNLKWADAPGNVRLSKSATGLDKESVANVSQVAAVDKALLAERVGKIAARARWSWCWRGSMWFWGGRRGAEFGTFTKLSP
jgi:hypothetical protein